MTSARELGQFRVQVNAIAFSIVRTGLTRTAHPDPSYEAQYVQDIPIGYIADPEDVAPPVIFLASRDANYITGITLNVTGGKQMAV